MNEQDKLIEEQFNKLPKILRETISAIQWKSSVKEISSANKLNPEQASVLEREIMFIIYGLENPSDLISNVIREVDVSEDVAIDIAYEVFEKILQPISLKADELDKGENKIQSVPSIHKIAPEIHPMVEPAFAQGSVMVKKGEVAHSVSHIEQPTPPKPPVPVPTKTEPEKVSLPDYRYPGGKDPYREPLQ